MIYLVDPAKASFSSETTLGDILIILNSFSYAIYVAVSKRLITKYGALKSLAWLFIFGSIVNVPVGLYFMQTVETRRGQHIGVDRASGNRDFPDDSRLLLECLGAGAGRTIDRRGLYLSPTADRFCCGDTFSR